jgi:hypothetical protein
MVSDDDGMTSGFANPPIDPTKNVRDLVEAEAAKRDALRVSDTELFDNKVKYIDDLRKADILRQDDLRKEQDRRTTDLARQRDNYEVRIENIKRDNSNQLEAVKSDFGKQIADILAAQSDKSAALLANQVDKFATVFGDRLALVEKNQYVAGGTSAARDPALDRKLDDIAAIVSKLQSGGNKQEGSSTAQNQMISWIIAAAAVAFAIYTNVTSSHAPPPQYVPYTTTTPAPAAPAR